MPPLLSDEEMVPDRAKRLPGFIWPAIGVRLNFFSSFSFYLKSLYNCFFRVNREYEFDCLIRLVGVPDGVKLFDLRPDNFRGNYAAAYLSRELVRC